MGKYEIIKLNQKSELKNIGANWSHSKWGVPYDNYMESNLFI